MLNLLGHYLASNYSVNSRLTGRDRLLQLNLDERILAISRIDNIMLHAFLAEIRRTRFHLGEARAILGYKFHLAVLQRHDNIIMPVPVPPRVVTRLEQELGDYHPVIVHMDDGFG
jgi:hypothetical protein